MKAIMQFRSYLICLLLVLPFGTAMADDDAAKYAETIKIFQDAGASGTFFNNSYGYAVFPTIGKGGIGVGGAYGKGRVYVGGKHVGNTSMSQLSIGFQLGAEAFSQIIFFEDQRAYDEFTSGNFEFSADASATAITAGASASSEHHRQFGRRQWWQERRHHQRLLPQGHGYVYRGQGWPDV